MTDATGIDSAMQELSDLVRADGSDLALVAVDGDTVRLALIVEDASCAECVLPRPLLEELSLGILRRRAPAVRSVTIDDPRERPDPT